MTLSNEPAEMAKEEKVEKWGYVLGQFFFLFFIAMPLLAASAGIAVRVFLALSGLG